jgi:hypothetical protein
VPKSLPLPNNEAALKLATPPRRRPPRTFQHGA